VVIPHPADELVEDVKPIDPESKYGPAQCRPVVENVVRFATALRCQAYAIGSGHRWCLTHRRRARRLSWLRGGLWPRLWFPRLLRFIAHQWCPLLARERDQQGSLSDRS